MNIQNSNQDLKLNTELILKLVKLPIFCQRCGCVSSNKDLLELTSTELGKLDQLHDVLVEKCRLLLETRNEQIKGARQELMRSIGQSSLLRESIQAFNFEDKERCLQRVCDDMFINVQEQLEIQNSLAELNMILEDCTSRQEYQDHLEIKERLQGALRINQSHKEILKEIVIKISEENKHFTFDVQLQLRQYQLETLQLLQTSQEQLLTIQRLEEELNQKLKFSSYMDNPFKHNKLHTDDSSQFHSVQQSQRLLQDIKNKQEKTNSGAYQSDQFYSIDQSNQSKQSQQSNRNGRYSNNTHTKFNSKTNLLQQLSIPQQVHVSNVKSSIDTNPMASQESDFHENSPKITPSSKTLLSKVPPVIKGKFLILD